jgi:hypothetical protein
MVKEALASLQGSVYLLEKNNQRIKTLCVELRELHGVKMSSTCEQDGSLDCNDPDVLRVPTYTCNDTCIALSGRVQRHL